MTNQTGGLIIKTMEININDIVDDIMEYLIEGIPMDDSNLRLLLAQKLEGAYEAGVEVGRDEQAKA